MHRNSEFQAAHSADDKARKTYVLAHFIRQVSTCNSNKKLYNWQTPDFKLCITI